MTEERLNERLRIAKYEIENKSKQSYSVTIARWIEDNQCVIDLIKMIRELQKKNSKMKIKPYKRIVYKER